jgi:uncharacterized protein YoxC
MIFEPMVRSAQTMHLSSVEINTISKETETIFHLIYATLEYHLVYGKAILEPVVHLVQTMHLSCLEFNTISKRTEMRVHLTNAT